jgi:hypothetical protein
MKNAALVASCLLSIALAACSKRVEQATEVLVSIESHLDSDLASIDVEIRDATDLKAGSKQHFDLRDKLELPLSFAVVPRDDHNATFVAVATGKDKDGNFLAQAKARAKFVSGKALGPLVLGLYESCLQVMCGQGDTCSPGVGTGPCSSIPMPRLAELLNSAAETRTKTGAPEKGKMDAGHAGSSGAGGGESPGSVDAGSDAANAGQGGAGGAAQPGSGGSHAGESGSGGSVAGNDGGNGACPGPGPDPAIADVHTACAHELDKACAQHASVDLLVCNSCVWTAGGACGATQRCDTASGTTQGTCQDIAALCNGKAVGDAVCDGTTRKRCDADLLRYDPYPCPANAHCTDTGSVGCVCDSGYKDDGAGGCTGDHCAAGNTCGVGGTCVEAGNDYSCNCASGYSGTGTKICSDTDECASSSTNVCTPDYPCVNLAPDYYCLGEFAQWPMPDVEPGAQTRPSYDASDPNSITDNVTHLVWQKVIPATYAGCTGNVAAAGDTCTLQQAKAYCASPALASTLGGAGWRLPTRIELESIVDHMRSTSALDTNVFPQPLRDEDRYWTASPYARQAGWSWHVNFDFGRTEAAVNTSNLRVRCVR